MVKSGSPFDKEKKMDGLHKYEPINFKKKKKFFGRLHFKNETLAPPIVTLPQHTHF